jgi:hypothetical protein
VQGNDISDGFQPCFLVVFEGLLGIPPDKTPMWWRRRSAKRRLADYEINLPLLGQIRRTPYAVEVVTFEDTEFANAVEERLDELHALIRRVWPTTHTELARIHLAMPDVAAIYDPDASRAFAAYGSLGRHLPPHNASQLGAH